VQRPAGRALRLRKWGAELKARNGASPVSASANASPGALLRSKRMVLGGADILIEHFGASSTACEQMLSDA